MTGHAAPGRHRTAVAAGLVVVGLLLSGCETISGTPVAAAGADPAAAASPGASAVSSAPSAASVSPGVDPTSPGNGSSADASAPGGDVTDYPEGDGVDPCKLVRRADAEKLAGTPVDAPVRGEHACTYTGPVTGPTAQVEIYVGLGAKKQLDIEHTLGHPVRKVPGVGDEAWISENGVYVRKGQLWVSVLVVLLEDPSQYAQRLRAVATTVAGRL